MKMRMVVTLERAEWTNLSREMGSENATMDVVAF